MFGVYIRIPRLIQKRINKTDYCVTFMYSSCWPAISLRMEKTSNVIYDKLVCLNVIIPFSTIVCCLIVTWSSKNVFCVNWKGEHKQLLGGARPPCPPIATALQSEVAESIPILHAEGRPIPITLPCKIVILSPTPEGRNNDPQFGKPCYKENFCLLWISSLIDLKIFNTSDLMLVQYQSKVTFCTITILYSK